MDIALQIAGGADGPPRIDWAMAGGDLAADAGLRSRVAVSLFSDALAATDDPIPDGTDDRRGWWGDLPTDQDDAAPIGSRMWLLAREKATAVTRQRAEAYATEALAWMLDRGVADAVDVTATWAGARGDQLHIAVALRRGASADPRFVFQWDRS